MATVAGKYSRDRITGFSIYLLKPPSPLTTPYLKATAIEHVKKKRGQGIHMAHVFSEQP